jgi:anhydro-N-acetylmuramic acid kinase
MSGTSGDGVDASIIQSDGDYKYEVILDRYFKYSQKIYENIHNLKDKINNSRDLVNLSKEIQPIEKEITLFHAQSANEIIKEFKSNIDFIGFHGQTIFHNSKEKVSKQLGDGKLLSQLTKRIVIYDFRKNDLKNGGEGAPLTPIFHKLIKNKYNLRTPLIILNIGGISNLTSIDSNEKIQSRDIGPGNCLIDQWIRLNSEKHYDQDGNIAKSGKINKEILNKALKNFKDKNDKKSYDVKDFDLSFVKRLSLKDGAATLTEYTSEILYKYLKGTYKNIIISGGGRKNKFLLNKIEKKINCKFKLIDDFKINGDFIESQAFAYLAIRSYLNLPISFPETTGVNKPCTGGEIIKY